ncbi:MAG: prepilin-type N-terminal cleavage/methylation domain-containing protein, partial [Xanthomonadales bacterium]|nr:prepilin-type N-terminal cleavage/methylation domain-containing protein [Xanthomonadales bacterium]NIX12562.1 prepilin-type N-terminal cleavage/methylation domain-containing protein [Xanthomonadales bacterium]
MSLKRLRPGGLTLIELLVVLAIVSLLVALALPSYQAYVRKANRGEAQQLLMNWANLQEIWRSNHTTYADDVAAPNGIPLPTHSNYVFSL